MLEKVPDIDVVAEAANGQEALEKLSKGGIDVVLMDMEAGVEHIGRGTASHVDVLLVIADSNLKALEIAKRIKDFAMNAKIKHIYLIGNIVKNDLQKTAIEEFASKNALKTLDFVPFDQGVIEKDTQGISPLTFSELEAVKTIDSISDKLIKVHM